MRKRRTNEYNLGDGLTTGVQALNDEPSTTTFEARPLSLGPDEVLGTPSASPSPLNTILERYANFEKVSFNFTFQIMISGSVSNYPFWKLSTENNLFFFLDYRTNGCRY